MSFDNSRFTFDPWKNYSGVVMEQGRVQLDADWNEWLAELSRRIQAGTLDIMGHASYPPTTPSAFLITAASGSPNTVTIGEGRLYVDGLLAENHGLHKTAVWDPALAELSGAPQPPNTASPNPNPIPFTKQPYLPGATVPADTGSYLAYLDVWTRAVDYLEDPDLVDKAVGVDTTGRLQTVWQVKLMANQGWTCQTPDSSIPYPPNSAGLLTTNVVPNPAAGPCCLTDGSGYTGVENQFYRVEIHQPGQGSDTPTSSTATFKWSRDNASVETAVTAINGTQNSMNLPASQLTVTSLGRDQVLGFHNGDWIEILDDWSELWGNPGVICQIDSISFPNKTITLTGTVDTTAAPPGPGVAANFPLGANNLTNPHRRTRIRRWNQSGKVYDSHGNLWCDLKTTGGLIPVPATKTLVLESGITVQFGLNPTSGAFNVADFWTFAARTADGSVEKLKAAPPRGIHHHYTKLSTITFSSPVSYSDCRTPWGNTGEENCGCCSCTVGDNQVSFGKYSKIQDAINSLQTTGPSIGGEICILPGRYYEYIALNGLTDVVIHGCGAQTRLASPSMKPGATPPDGGPTNPIATETGFAAIVTAVNCEHIEFRSFAIEAADGEVGILLDASPQSDGLAFARKRNLDGPKESHLPPVYFEGLASNSEVTIDDLTITASTLPAILANDASVLKIANNRVAIEDVAGQWASIYVSGSEIQIEKNWVGLQDDPNAELWISDIVSNDVSAGFNADVPPAPLANGGIHIAEDSNDVSVIDNDIQGGAFNAITLGSFILIPPNGGYGNGTITGLLPTPPTASSQTTLMLPPADNFGNQIAAGDSLQDIEIARNRISNTSLCGIGPVGFFNLPNNPELISIQDLTITGNTIASTLQGTLAQLASGTTGASALGNTTLGYGAICLPDVQNLILRDNTVTDFGVTPGAQVCGIYLLSGEQVEISRNQVIETRDWSELPSISGSTTTGPQGGISIAQVSAPLLDQSQNLTGWTCSADGVPPMYEPGLPALRVEQNVVRVPLGLALQVLGSGPYSIVNNQFSSGGTIQPPQQPGAPASGLGEYSSGSSLPTGLLTVEVINIGTAIDAEAISATLVKIDQVLGKLLNVGLTASSGSVVFTGNVCQAETRSSGATGLASVAILTLDHLIFTNNHCWVDACRPLYYGHERYFLPFSAAITDVFVAAPTLQVFGNRLQESPGSVFCSGITIGFKNLTAQNLSTLCLYALPATHAVNNVSLSTGCDDQLKALLAKLEAILSQNP